MKITAFAQGSNPPITKISVEILSEETVMCEPAVLICAWQTEDGSCELDARELVFTQSMEDDEADSNILPLTFSVPALCNNRIAVFAYQTEDGACILKTIMNEAEPSEGPKMLVRNYLQSYEYYSKSPERRKEHFTSQYKRFWNEDGSAKEDLPTVGNSLKP